LIRKLSSILRKLLQEQESFIPLREELDFIDSYLDIESVRFGSGKLVVEKDVDRAVLDTFVPSMIVQPLVENAIKHGISKRLEGGRIVIRARREEARVVIEIEDNGTGLPQERNEGDSGEGLGIGLTNVNERLKVIYGEGCQLGLTRIPERGTLARLEIPEMDLSYLRAG
jgi:two-component system, LytTR family, sensor kinase